MSTVRPNTDVEIGYLFSNLSDELALTFKIDRDSKACYTPTRNPNSARSLAFYSQFGDWAAQGNPNPHSNSNPNPHPLSQ